MNQIVFSKIKKWGFNSFKWTGISLLGLVILFFILNWIFPLRSNIEYATVVTDSKGEVINAFLTSDQQWRMKTELSEISPLLQKQSLQKRINIFILIPVLIHLLW